jgi:hypothetical protein
LPAVGHVVQGLAYIAGGGLLGAGAYLMMRGFPDWWVDRMLWPLRDVSPRVTRLQALAAIALGLSILAIGFTPIVPAITGGALVLAALVAYVAAVALFLYSTWLSRRIAP